MALHSVFESAIESANPLQRIESSIWESLAVAATSSRHPWNHGVFNTVEISDGSIAEIRSRTVILRSSNCEAKTIECHTDVRSKKVQDLNSNSVASWTFYDSKSKIQLRVAGTARVFNGERADQAWSSTSLRSRSSYLSIAEPGSIFGSDKPPSTGDRFVAQEESERGRKNFRLVQFQVEEIDFLYLRRTGHVRMKACYSSKDATDLAWLIP